MKPQVVKALNYGWETQAEDPLIALPLSMFVLAMNSVTTVQAILCDDSEVVAELLEAFTEHGYGPDYLHGLAASMEVAVKDLIETRKLNYATTMVAIKKERGNGHSPV